MDKAETLQHISTVLSGAVSAERAERAVERAARLAGLGTADTIEERELTRLLAVLAAEGGKIQQAAERIASWRSDGGDGPSDLLW